jgi:ABC-type transport system involved in multi-copper enzyme maturation permease subunit
MIRALDRFTLPLLAKELTEQAARRRTFVVRAIYAALLYGVTLWGFSRQIGRWDSGSFALLGTGHILFEQVLSFQMFAVFALLPMLTASVLTSEKERDTLGILLITRLGAGTIILEKFLSRVIPMLLYLLLSLPLMGVAYSLGGVESGAVLAAGLLLVGMVLHIGSLGVFSSAYCRTTTQALLLTYVLLFLLAVPLAMALRLANTATGQPSSTPLPAGWPSLWLFLVAGLLPALLWLFLARVVLWPRAFLQPRNFGLRVLRWLDGLFHRLNQNRITKGIVVLDERVELPRFRPIAWRETMKRSLGTVRYLVRFLLLVEGPLLFVILIPLSDASVWQSRQYLPVEIAAFAVWWVTIFAVLSQSTALVAGERARQTLDVLLSTPLSAEQLVREKFAGVQRLITVLMVPLGTVFLFRGWWYIAMSDPWRRFNEQVFLLTSLGSAVVYPPLMGWLGFHASLRFKSQVTAMTAALGIVLVLAGLPWALDWVGVYRGDSEFGGLWGTLTTVVLPATGPNVSPWADTAYSTRMGRFRTDGAWRDFLPLLLLMHFAVYAGLWQWLRWTAAGQLVRFTNRCEQAEFADPRGIHRLRERVCVSDEPAV